MGIIQEKRLNAQKPSVSVTDYGAKYIKAGTETPIEKSQVPVSQEEKTIPSVSEQKEAQNVTLPVEKRRGGRPKKNAKKE